MVQCTHFVLIDVSRVVLVVLVYLNSMVFDRCLISMYLLHSMCYFLLPPSSLYLHIYYICFTNIPMLVGT